ncbi:MAG: hypothetical protein H0U10_16990 [Chloroflexia bacterium]|nr:hypothetical protein [Chloroflexia bacterium]
MLVTEERSRLEADPVGSPLEGIADVVRVDWTPAMDEAERAAAFDAALPEAEAIVVSPWCREMPPFDTARWEKAGRLKVIAGTFDNRFGHWLDVGDAGARGVTVVDTSRSMTPTVAEFALAMTLNLIRDIPASVEVMRRGEWLTTRRWDQPGFVSGDLTGRRVGLAGFGSINRRYAELIAPFRCDLVTCDPFVSDATLADAGVGRAATLEELAAGCEIFIVGIPPTPATEGIISASVIDALPRGSLFVLVTRMAVVAQDALWRRAEAGEIRAAIDVFAPEPPPPDASFRTSPFVQATPHIAGNTHVCHRRCFTTACEDALATLAGRAPVYPVSVHDAKVYDGVVG